MASRSEIKQKAFDMLASWFEEHSETRNIHPGELGEVMGVRIGKAQSCLRDMVSEGVLIVDADEGGEDGRPCYRLSPWGYTQLLMTLSEQDRLPPLPPGMDSWITFSDDWPVQ